MRVHEALAAIACSCIEQIAANQPIVTLTDNAEAVHKMRVGLRRLRSAFSLFRSTWGGKRLPFEADLRWLHGLLGTARDWDIFLKVEIDPLSAESSHNTAIQVVDASVERARTRAYKALRQAIRSRRYTRIWTRLDKWLHMSPEVARRAEALDQPIGDYSAEVLRNRERKVRKLGRQIADLDPSDLHRLRIRTKKLRYAAEFFRDLYPRKRMTRTIDRVTGLQELLGDLNDLSAGRRLLHQIHTNRGDRDTDFIRGKSLIEGWIIARSRTSHDDLEPRWKRYKKVKSPWQ